RDPEERLVVLRAALEEVDGDDAEAVEGVEGDGPHEHDLTERHEGRLVRVDDGVVGPRGDADECGVEHVHEQEEEDSDAGHAVCDPRPHAFSSAIQSASCGLGLGASSSWDCRLLCTCEKYAARAGCANRG